MHRKETLSRLALVRMITISIIFPVIGIWLAISLMKRRNKVLGRGGTQGVLAMSDMMRSDERFRGQLILKWIAARVERERESESLIKASVQPEVDLAFNPDVEVRKRAVMKLSQSRKPRRLQVLRDALRDPSNEVRTLAGIVLSQIEQHFIDEIEGTPHLADRVQLRITRVACGFLIGSLRDRELEIAMSEVLEVLKLEPNNSDAIHMHARVHFLKGDFGTALTLFEKAIQIKGGTFARSQGFLLECWFRLGMWDELKEASQKALSDPQRVPPILMRSIQFWGAS